MQTVAKLIRNHAPAILRAWTEDAKRATSAKNLTGPELESFMPDSLALLGEDGPAANPSTSPPSRAGSPPPWGQVERVVDEFLSTTPAMADERSR